MGEIEAPALGNPGTAEGLLFLPPDHETQNPLPITELFRTVVEDRSKRVAFRSQALNISFVAHLAEHGPLRHDDRHPRYSDRRTTVRYGRGDQGIRWFVARAVV